MATNDETAALAAPEAAKARKFKRAMKAMKSAVLEVQLILYEGVNTDEQLHSAGRILAQSEYGDVVEERYIAKVCGFARCANALPTETRKGRYRISLSAKKVYDLQESRHFCSPSCLIASKDFGNKLPLQRDLVESTERLMAILGLVRGLQYEARSNTVKENDMRKTPARPRNTKRGKVRPKDTRNAHPASSDRIRSPVEDRGQLESGMVSANLSTLPTASILEHSNRVGNLNTPQIEQSNSTASNSSSSFERVLVMPSTSESDGKAADTHINSPLNAQKLRPEKDSLSSTSIASTVQTKFEKLKIQERVGDQEVLPMFDYGGPSDAIEGYVPSRSRWEAASHTESRIQSKVSERTNSNVDVASSSGLREDQRVNIAAENKNTEEVASNVLREEVQRSGSSSRSQQKRVKVVKEWEDLVTGSPQTGPAKMCITEVDGETSISDSGNEWSAGDSAGPLSSSSSKSKDFQGKSANLKPALKKSKVKSNVRSVAWADQNRSNSASDIGKIESKERASGANGDETPNFEKGSEDVITIEKKLESMKLEEQQRSQTRLSEPTLDLAMAARLASAEAIATALTEAATSAAAGEVDGSEAVVQAGISILSATHNAYPASSDSPHEAQDQSGETLEFMKNSAFDEDELFARAAQARDEMRRLKLPRKYGEIMEKEGFENGDVIDDFKSITNEDDDDEDEDVDDVNVDDADAEEEDDDYFDDSGGFEGAREVGFTAPPKGFKAEVSMFGTMIMAIEAWISASAVAHIYGKDPHQEDEYLSVNGREYSRYAFIGDGVSAEILRTFSLCVSRALPEVVRALRISVPLSTLELALGRLIKTMSFVEALPPFGTKQWRVLVILLLDALSIHRIPRLGVYFSNNRTMLRQVLDSTDTSEAEYDVFRDVVLPLGRSPTFATRSGG